MSDLESRLVSMSDTLAEVAEAAEADYERGERHPDGGPCCLVAQRLAEFVGRELPGVTTANQDVPGHRRLVVTDWSAAFAVDALDGIEEVPVRDVTRYLDADDARVAAEVREYLFEATEGPPSASTTPERPPGRIGDRRNERGLSSAGGFP